MNTLGFKPAMRTRGRCILIAGILVATLLLTGCGIGTIAGEPQTRLGESAERSDQPASEIKTEDTRTESLPEEPEESQQPAFEDSSASDEESIVGGEEQTPLSPEEGLAAVQEIIKETFEAYGKNAMENTVAVEQMMKRLDQSGLVVNLGSYYISSTAQAEATGKALAAQEPGSYFLYHSGEKLVAYEFTVTEEAMTVKKWVASSQKVEEGEPQPVRSLEFSPSGWLLFETEDHLFSNRNGHGFRLRPLERTLGETYLYYADALTQPYGNLLASSWDEERAPEIASSVLFALSHQLLYQQEVAWNNYTKERGLVSIPASEVEETISGCFPFSQRMIRELAEQTGEELPFQEEKSCYLYRPTASSGQTVQNEIIAAQTDPDGTVVLTIHQVSPQAGDDGSTHPVYLTLEQVGEDGFRYHSNRVGANK